MSHVIVTPEFLNLESPYLARAILEYIVANADIVGEDIGGRPIMRFEFACDTWLQDKLASDGAAGEDLEPEPEGNRCATRACWSAPTCKQADSRPKL